MRIATSFFLVAFASALLACGGDDTDPARAHSDASPGGVTVLPDGATILPDGAVIPTPDGSVDDLDAAPPPKIDAGYAFDYAPPYVETLGPSSRSDAGHNFATNTPPSNPAKTMCIDCHKAGASAASRPFFAGGTVKFTNGTPAPKVEVRLKAYLSATSVVAYTDDDGNWYVPSQVAADAGVTFSVRPGVRNATSMKMMTPSPAIGRCNQCHIASL